MTFGQITENYARKDDGNGLFYLAAGPADGPLLIFVHGWPELAISWTTQLATFGRLGFRAIAPDMPGYGRSTIYNNVEAYALETIVGEMRFLLDALGAEKAVWIGHDMGTPVVWSIASHHPELCHAVAALNVPYRSVEVGLEHLLSTIDRDVYPADIYPVGMWDYRYYYLENFAEATAAFDAAPENVVKAIFVPGNPAEAGKPQFIAKVRKAGGWFGGAGRAPDGPLDTSILSVEEFHQFASALRKNGFFGPDSYYMNHTANDAYAQAAVNDFRLDMPVLFIHGALDYTPECINSRIADDMRRLCSNLTSVSIQAGHWVAQERPAELASAIAHWLATSAKIWPPLTSTPWRPLD